MIYMGNMKDATQGLNSDATPLFIEEVGTDEVGEYVFKNDNVRLRIGTGFNKDRKQVKAEGYEYKDMSKYYRK